MLSPVPDGVADVQAATLPTAGVTALRSLELGGLVLAKRVLITGATGGVGRIAVQLARAAGAHVSALVRNATVSAPLLHELGAREVIERLEGDFDLVIDCVGGAVFGQAAEHLAQRGILVNIATQSPEQTVSFRAGRFDRSPGATYTLNQWDESAAQGGAARTSFAFVPWSPMGASTGRPNTKAPGGNRVLRGCPEAQDRWQGSAASRLKPVSRPPSDCTHRDPASWGA